MRKVIFQMLVTLDGLFEGPNREIDWHNVDEEFNEYAIDFLQSLGVLLFGRVTYELMVLYWPTESATTDDPIVAERMNNLAKIVFSQSLKEADWNNTRLVSDDVAGEISKLKQQPGKDLAIFGSSDLVVSLIRMRLIDEFRVIVNPIVLGGGKSLFQGIDGTLKLKPIKTRRFRSGNVLPYYHPDKT